MISNATIVSQLDGVVHENPHTICSCIDVTLWEIYLVVTAHHAHPSHPRQILLFNILLNTTQVSTRQCALLNDMQMFNPLPPFSLPFP